MTSINLLSRALVVLHFRRGEAASSRKRAMESNGILWENVENARDDDASHNSLVKAENVGAHTHCRFVTSHKNLSAYGMEFLIRHVAYV